MPYKALFLALVSLASALSLGGAARADASDPFLWLEDIGSARSLEWVSQQNAATEARLANRAIYRQVKDEMTAILSRNDRLPAITLAQGYVYTFWQDAAHPRGLWQRMLLEPYRAGSNQWDVILDLDALDKAEGKDWVWKGANCLAPAAERCLISLSPGGGDAAEVREFSVSRKAFVEGGFRLEMAKSDASWLDENTLLVGTDFGPGSLSKSGYPIVSKRWKRGTPLAEATELFRGQTDDMTVSSFVAQQPGWQPVFLQRYVSFFASEQYLLNDDGSKTKLPLPTDAKLDAVIGAKAFFTLRSELKAGAVAYAAGSLVAYPLLAAGEGERSLEKLELVFAPSARRFLSEAVRSGNDLLLNVLDNVKGKVLRAFRVGNGWRLAELALGENGMAEVTDASAFDTAFLATYMDFLTPTTQILGDSALSTAATLRSSPAYFDASGDVTEQLEATSKDGTKVPYFVVRPRGQRRDGSNPTLLYGYGGFQLSMTPRYSGSVGKAWIEKGGTYVVANIRGGGELGPAWHEAARKERRQNAFDDFIAVAEDLIARGITSPSHLGIEGGSNGGLLMGAVTMQRPDLFNAVLCEVPLLDMMRFHLLLAGASWIDEYGNPEIPAERELLLRYSPYQNVKPGQKYPEIFFQTSTHDDRVHPGHARKMAALLESLGYGTYFFENREGGHGGSATPEQRAKLIALSYSYLWGKLGRSP